MPAALAVISNLYSVNFQLDSKPYQSINCIGMFECLAHVLIACGSGTTSFIL